MKGRRNMADSKENSFEDLLKLGQPAQQACMRRLRAVIFDLHPDACEVVRLGERAATYGVGPKKMSEGYAYIMPHTAWVNLGFFRGADLPDPAGLLEGTGAKLRHVKIRALEDIERAPTRALLVAALKERRDALG